MSDVTIEGPTLTYSQARNRADEVHARMEQIAELDNPTDEENVEFRSLGEEFDTLIGHMTRLEREAELARIRSAHTQVVRPGQPRLRVEPGASLRVDRGSRAGSADAGSPASGGLRRVDRSERPRSRPHRPGRSSR